MIIVDYFYAWQKKRQNNLLMPKEREIFFFILNRVRWTTENSKTTWSILIMVQSSTIISTINIDWINFCFVLFWFATIILNWIESFFFHWWILIWNYQIILLFLFLLCICFKCMTIVSFVLCIFINNSSNLKFLPF